jgi:hypothetical protein
VAPRRPEHSLNQAAPSCIGPMRSIFWDAIPARSAATPGRGSYSSLLFSFHRDGLYPEMNE